MEVKLVEPSDSDGTGRVKCDEEGCGWSADIDYSQDNGDSLEKALSEWYHTPCPECGEGEIITDEDMKTAMLLDSFVVVDRAVIERLKSAGKEVPKGKTIHVDTAESRQ